MELKFEHVNVFNGKDVLFSDLNFVINSGSITSFVSGSDIERYEFARLLAGLTRINEGSIVVGETVLTNGSKIKDNILIGKRVGVVFNNPYDLFFNKSVYDELLYGFKLNKDLDYVEKRILDTLKIVGLSKTFLTRKPETLSSGEALRLGIAIALINNPEVLVFNDVTTGLDNVGKRMLIKLINMMSRKYNKTIILITNDTDVVFSLNGSVSLMMNGRILASGDKYSVFSMRNVLEKCDFKIPDIMQFKNIAYFKYGIKLGNVDNVNDLMKEVYRHVKK